MVLAMTWVTLLTVHDFRENKLDEVVKLTEQTLLGGTGHGMTTQVRGEEIREFTLGHETLARLRPKVYHFVPDDGLPFDADPTAEHVGFFHGDVAAAGFHPDTKSDVGDDAPTGALQLDMRPILAALVNAVNEQTEAIEVHSRMLQVQAKMLRQVMSRLERLEEASHEPAS